MFFLQNWSVSKGFERVGPRELKGYLKAAYIFQTSKYSIVILKESFLYNNEDNYPLIELLFLSVLLVTGVPLHAAIPL